MSEEVIYEMKYPREELFPCQSEQPHTETVKQESQAECRTFEEINMELMESTALILLPDRIKKSEHFIKEAIEVSKLYHLDTTITRHDSHITVTYSFDCGGSYRYLKPVLVMGDEYSFFSGVGGRGITLCIDFFTHAVLRNGRVVYP